MDRRRTLTSIAVVTLLLMLIGFVANSVSTKCDVVQETISVTLDLDPASDYCGQSSITINNIVRGNCSNNGDNCENYHDRDVGEYDNEETFCVPTTTTVVSGSVSIPVPNCGKSVNYRYVNIIACGCKLVHAPSAPVYSDT